MDPVSPPLTGVAADVGRFVLVPHSVFPDVEIGPAYPGHGLVARHVRGGLAQGAVAPTPSLPSSLVTLSPPPPSPAQMARITKVSGARIGLKFHDGSSVLLQHEHRRVHVQAAQRHQVGCDLAPISSARCRSLVRDLALISRY